jgi:hypothetical protein
MIRKTAMLMDTRKPVPVNARSNVMIFSLSD